MKNKFLFGAMAALMTAACSQDEVVSVQQDGIAYSVSAGKQTRAADSYCNTSLPESFKVWAKSTDGLYINGDKIVNNGGVWTDQDGTRYWPENKTLDFYAEVNGDDEFSFNNGTPTFSNFTVEGDVTKQLDLMYSVRKNQSKANDKVQLNFRHALSQVCFKAKNNTKNMSVEIKGVTVGHLANSGTFKFPTEDTDENYTQHSDVPAEKQLNGGTWTLPENAQYNNEYSVQPWKNGSTTSVTLAPDAEANLTCPENAHTNGFNQVLNLLPQTVNAWDPTSAGQDYNGAYFLVDLVLSNIVKDVNNNEVHTIVYTGKAAVPVNVKWLQGYRYIYTFVFNEGGSGGWTPDPSDPKPLLATIKYDVTVDDFIPVNGDGDGTDMDADKYKYSTTLTLHANDGTSTVKTVTLNSNESSYSFTLASEYTPSREGFNFSGWATTKEGTVEYKEGASVQVDMTKSLDLFAVWSKAKTITLTFDGNHEYAQNIESETMPENLSASVDEGSEATFTIPDKTPQLEGWVFKGWAEAAGGSVKYQKNTEVKTSESKTLYAVWEEKGSSGDYPGTEY